MARKKTTRRLRNRKPKQQLTRLPQSLDFSDTIKIVRKMPVAMVPEQFPAESLVAFHVFGNQPKQGISAFKTAYLTRLLMERAKRRKEALRLYEPIPAQLAFHTSGSKVRVLRGSNRGGKTLPAAVEVARAVCGMDPHGKYPKKNGRCWIVGKDLNHIGEVMWRKLRRESFKIIRDAVSGEWRAYRPWDPADLARATEVKYSPPLIPDRLIKRVAWENKAKGIPKKVVLKNGWEMNFYSSEGKPPRGADIDLWWFDEEIMDDDWYPEMMARIVDRSGRGIWSATPQSGSEMLLDLHEKATKLADDPNAWVREFLILLFDNPHVSEADKKALLDSLDDAEISTRIHGEFQLKHRVVFPEFHDSVHCVDAFPVPPHWTRYAFIDPGRQVCAVAFAAVPPMESGEPFAGDFVYLYDELYLKNCSAEDFGKAMGAKSVGQEFEAFIIDDHGARLVDIGSGKSAREQYSDALKKYRVFSRKTQNNFLPGNDDVEGGVEAVRGYLRIRDNGTPRLRVFRSMKHFLQEIRRYRYQMIGKVLTDKPEARGNVHQMANLRYLCSFPIRYVEAPGKAIISPALAAYRAKQARQKKDKGRIHLGPGDWKGGR